MARRRTTVATYDGEASDASSSNGRSSRSHATAAKARSVQGKATATKGKRVAQKSSMSGGGKTVSVTTRSASQHGVVPHVVLETINAPKIECDSLKALARWMDLRLEYEGIVRSNCQGDKDEIKKRMVSVRNSFDEGLLDVLCMTVWRVKKKTLTEDFLWEWIKTKLKTPLNGERLNLKEMFGGGKLSMDMSEEDIVARTTMYFKQCWDIIKEHAATEQFQSKKAVRLHCKILVEMLPRPVQEKVEEVLAFDTDAEKDLGLLREAIEKCLKEYERERRGKRRRDESSDDDDYHRKRARTRVRQDKKRKVRTDMHVRSDKRHVKNKFTKGSKDKSIDKSSEGCWECGGNHLKKDCPEQKFRSHKRNEALNWDYVYLGESFGDFEYLLVMKDDATHYVELVPCTKPTSTVTAEAILD